MAKSLRSLTGSEAFECAGEAFGAAGATGRKPFSLPGDRPVWGRDRPLAIEHVKLEVSFDVRQRRLRGVAATTFRPRADGLREAVLDAYELDVESVTDGNGRSLAFTNSDGKLRIDLGRARSSRRSITTVVRYSTRPRRGVYFNQPDGDYPDRPAQIWTQGQPEDAPYWFPCFDYPGEKATSELIAEVPLGWFALSNGRLESATDDRRRRRSTYHWAQDVPHPAYLVSLAAAEFDTVEDSADGVPVQYYGPKGSADDLRRAFGRTPDMVRFFAQKIGVPYPYAKYATVAIHDFTWGGMENTSATTMTDTLLHDERAHEDLAEPCDGITAHELAHQWFGDLLTCREWSHGWLNESFATYFNALYIEHARGWDDFRYELYQNAKAYLEEDSGSYRRPLVENVYHAPIDIFDRHLYQRGALVLDMLRSILGDELWWKAIHHYVTSHAGGDVLTHEFQRAIEVATGRNLDWFFEQWVWKGGHPEFKATYSWDGEHRQATVQLQQTQQPDDRLTSVYRSPLEIAFMTRRGLQRFNVEVTEAQHSFVFQLDSEPRFVAVDPANRVLKTLDFEPGEAQLKARLADDPQAVGRIDAAKGLAKIGSPDAIEALRDALRNERELRYVRAEVAAALGTTKAESARDALIAATGAGPSLVRRAVATALGNFRDARSARALQGFLTRRGDGSYYVQSAAADALGATRQPAAFAALRRVLDRPAHNDVITAAALTGLGKLRDVRAVDTLLDYTQRGRHPTARRAAVAALGTLGPFAGEPERARIREQLEELLDDARMQVQLAAAGALTALGDARAAPALEAVASRSLEGRVTRAGRIAARTLGERADKGEEVQGLKDEVERLQQTNQTLKDRLTKLEATVNGAGGRRTPSRGGQRRGGRR